MCRSNWFITFSKFMMLCFIILFICFMAIFFEGVLFHLLFPPSFFLHYFLVFCASSVLDFCFSLNKALFFFFWTSWREDKTMFQPCRNSSCFCRLFLWTFSFISSKPPEIVSKGLLPMQSVLPFHAEFIALPAWQTTSKLSSLKQHLFSYHQYVGHILGSFVNLWLAGGWLI